MSELVSHLLREACAVGVIFLVALLFTRVFGSSAIWRDKDPD